MAAPAIKKYGGKVLARGPSADRHDGALTGAVMMSSLRANKPLRHSLVITVLIFDE
jgi:uncharacterized protein (DUF1330 family)